MGAMASPVVGAAGNVEYFLHARAHAGAQAMSATTAALLDEALAASPDSPSPESP
jgi:hypothetical protein